MTRKYPALAAPQVIRVLRKNGFRLISQKGSHQKWSHPDGPQVIVPVHGKKILPIGTLKSIIDGSGIPLDSFKP